VTGRIVAFEGLDGSGKSTQVSLLLDRLRSTGVEHEYISFPRTEEPGYGEAIAMFLRGEFGAVEDVSPYLIASLFAGDRAAAKPLLDTWLQSGKLIVADRYFYSNLAFQSAKLLGSAKKQHFRAWLKQVEFGCHRIPPAALTVFFDVPFAFVQSNIIHQRPHEVRSYLNGHPDIHETALDLQERVAIEYRSLAADDSSFCTISCADVAGQMRTVQDIHQEVTRLLEVHELVCVPRKL
jgi:dTMP kinase